MDNKKCVLVFIKFPEKGKVKSRLSEAFDTDMVLSLYECFVFDLLETLKKGTYALKICFSPPETYENIVRWLGREYSYMPQKGNDLGERMKNAFMDSFSEGFSEVVLIGSDIPDLTIEVIHEAFAFDLYDASIGPASDGGYYLIGFTNKTFLPEIFKGIEWGTDTVLKQTMKLFKSHKHTVRVLPVWHDVDRPEDVQALYSRNRDTEFAASRTMRFLSANPGKLFKNMPLSIPL
jgi:rSAM/selenodomain-associated transferase 1